MVKNKENFRVITTTNENKTYLPFWPTMAQNWKKFCGFDKMTLGFITERDEDDPLVDEMREYGDVTLFKPIKNIDTGVQAKVTRMYLASQYVDDYSIIADIDMYVLNKNFLWDNWFSKVEDDRLLAIGGNLGVYGSTGKFPMAFTTAKGNIWSEAINPSNLSYVDLLNSWLNLKVFKNCEAVGNKFRNFSDESLLRALIALWDNYGGKMAYHHPKVKHIERNDCVGGRPNRRIDRSRWRIDINKLNNNFFIDCQPLRPFNGNALKDILIYLGIDEDKWNLKN